MAAGYKDLIGLVSNTNFQAETQLAVMHYAQFIVNQMPGNANAYSAKKVAWAYEIITNKISAGTVASQIANALIQDAAFTSQNSGLSSDAMLAAVADGTFQSAVENAINSTFLA